MRMYQRFPNLSALSLAVVIGGLSALTCGKTAVAVDILDDPVQIEERVTQVMQTSNSLCWEMYRYHQQQPNYLESYRAAKDVWSKAAQMKDALWNGPVQTDVLLQQVNDLNQDFTQLEKTLLQWGTGDRSAFANTVSGQRTVVRDGLEIDVPFIGVRLGGPGVVVTNEGSLQLQRLRLHANSRGTKRSLEREIAAVRLAINYLMEDAGVSNQPNTPTPAVTPTDNAPTPQPPKPDSTLEKPKSSLSGEQQPLGTSAVRK